MKAWGRIGGTKLQLDRSTTAKAHAVGNGSLSARVAVLFCGGRGIGRPVGGNLGVRGMEVESGRKWAG